jgi:hypothetical protein
VFSSARNGLQRDGRQAPHVFGVQAIVPVVLRRNNSGARPAPSLCPPQINLDFTSRNSEITGGDQRRDPGLCRDRRVAFNRLIGIERKLSPAGREPAEERRRHFANAPE